MVDYSNTKLTLANLIGRIISSFQKSNEGLNKSEMVTYDNICVKVNCFSVNSVLNRYFTYFSLDGEKTKQSTAYNKLSGYSFYDAEIMEDLLSELNKYTKYKVVTTSQESDDFYTLRAILHHLLNRILGISEKSQILNCLSVIIRNEVNSLKGILDCNELIYIQKEFRDKLDPKSADLYLTHRYIGNLNVYLNSIEIDWYYGHYDSVIENTIKKYIFDGQIM